MKERRMRYRGEYQIIIPLIFNVMCSASEWHELRNERRLSEQHMIERRSTSRKEEVIIMNILFHLLIFASHLFSSHCMASSLASRSNRWGTVHDKDSNNLWAPIYSLFFIYHLIRFPLVARMIRIQYILMIHLWYDLLSYHLLTLRNSFCITLFPHQRKGDLIICHVFHPVTIIRSICD